MMGAHWHILRVVAAPV